jgi:D-3-phosphoglycerate dehydrogenase
LLEVLGPYLRLCDKLGSLQGQILERAPQEVRIEYAGEVTSYDVNPLTLAILRGLLTHVVSSSAVNYVNAPSIARERGIKVIEAKTSETKGFTNMVTVRVATEGGTSSVVAGAIFGRDIIRLVRIDDFFLDADPEGYIVMLHNRDVPGVVGSVGVLLAEEKINIARLELGREHVGGKAVSLTHVDAEVSDDVLNRLRQLPNIVAADLIKL